MEGAATPDRDALVAFEVALDARVCDEVQRESWGRLFLSPSTPLVWDANWCAIEAPGPSLAEAVAIGDEELGGAGFAHRTVCPLGEAEGARLGAELEADAASWPGWEVERTRYMLWRGGEVDASPETRESPMAEIEGLRQALIAEEMPAGTTDLEATVDQLYEIDRRYGEAAGDRWFVAPAEDPASCCRLLRRSGIAQVEDVGTRRDSRGRGHAKAIVLAAVAAAQAAGDEAIFLTADAADWPQLMYAKLGFEEVGNLTVLRRRP
jgi:GNAT superfamily N-acetyltransferase